MMERAVVTGASGGIGAACVESLQELGAEVIGVDLSPTSPANVHLTLDLADPSSVEAVARQVGDAPLDLLVNNAAVGHSQPAVETSSEAFDAVIAVNLRAPFLLASALLPALRARSGSVVNVASVHAVATSAPASVYAASKGGLVSLTRALAIEWGPEVRVNCVLPGAIDTPMLTEGLARAGRTLESFGTELATGVVGVPSDVAEAVVFLATSRYVTGASLIVDGGATARLSTE
jgi:NAD(P)-dependent dehydrogenase (short-subunit alcohol dehydrogenase family)